MPSKIICKSNDHPQVDNSRPRTRNASSKSTQLPPVQRPPPPNRNMITTPCRQMAQLDIKSKTKQPKLLSSKSLSQLLPKNLFFKNGKKRQTTDKTTPDASGLTHTKSFPTGALHSSFIPELKQRQRSDSLLGLSRLSSGGAGTCASADQITWMEEPNFSPIVGSIITQVASEECTTESPSDSANSYDKPNVKTDKEDKSERSKTSTRLKTLKSTKQALKDVKNSIGLRIKARHESQAFTKLNNELLTPPTKLYSPFNIHSESSAMKRKSAKSRVSNDQNSSFMPIPDEETPKRRIALQHKQHLMQANKFNFISPAGKLKDTIRDVEHFQQCIEDISNEILARDQNTHDLLNLSR